MTAITPPTWLGCPVCRGSLARTETGLYCPTDEMAFPLQGGIYRLLPPDEREAADAYAEEYREQREAQGWRPLTGDELAALPEKAPAGWDRIYWPVRRQSFEAFLAWLATLEAPTEGPIRIVDMGAGLGWLAGRLATHDHEVVALDLSADDAFGLTAIRELANRLANPPILVQGDIDRPPFQPDQVDLLIYSASVHYAVDLAGCLKAAASTLRPGGALVIMDTPVLTGDFTALPPVEGEPIRKGRQVPLAELARALDEAGLAYEIRPIERGWRWTLRQWRIRFFGGVGFDLPLIIARRPVS